VIFEQNYTTPSGRRRRRQVTVDPGTVRALVGDPGPDDREDWQRFRSALAALVPESMFAVWLSEMTLGGVTGGGELLAVSPIDTRAWIAGRYGQVIADAGRDVGRVVLLADEAQTRAIHATNALAAQQSPPPGPGLSESGAGGGRVPPPKEAG
jgi:hypothetical protein